MFLFKLFQAFLSPSVFIFVIFLIGTFFFKKRVGKFFVFLGIILYYLFSISFISNLIISPLETKYQPINKEELNKTNATVLLLGGKESDVLRCAEVLFIYNEKSNKTDFKVVISGDNPVKSEIKEAESMRIFLINRGIATDNIILEDKSRNTYESAIKIKDLLGNELFFLVTSAYHMPRAILAFKSAKTNPFPAPTDFKIEEDYTFLDFFPDSRNLKKTDLAFHEYFGIIFYRFLKY